MCGGHPNTPQSIFEKWAAENGLSGDKAKNMLLLLLPPVLPRHERNMRVHSYITLSRFHHNTWSLALNGTRHANLCSLFAFLELDGSLSEDKACFVLRITLVRHGVPCILPFPSHMFLVSSFLWSQVWETNYSAIIHVSQINYDRYLCSVGQIHIILLHARSILEPPLRNSPYGSRLKNRPCVQTSDQADIWSLRSQNFISYGAWSWLRSCSQSLDTNIWTIPAKVAHVFNERLSTSTWSPVSVLISNSLGQTERLMESLSLRLYARWSMVMIIFLFPISRYEDTENLRDFTAHV